VEEPLELQAASETARARETSERIEARFVIGLRRTIAGSERASPV
jgi:hypothetical protein